MKVEFSISEIEFDVRRNSDYISVNGELFNKNEAIELASTLISVASEILEMTKYIKGKEK